MSNPEPALRIVRPEEPVVEIDMPAHPQTIRNCVEEAMRNYFTQLDGHNVNDVYQMVLTEVEVPLLEVVLEYTRNNQSRAAEVLGLNRGTLRKKLKQYDML